MKYRYNKNTFLRKIGECAYLYSQQTRCDRFYDSYGLVFLNAISRIPKDFESILKEIANSFIDVQITELRNDLLDFLTDLVLDKFLVCGETETECYKNEVSYSAHGKKDILNSYSSIPNFKSTNDSFQEEFKKLHRLHSFQIELTKSCNEHCTHCYIPKLPNRNDLNTKIVFDVLEQLNEIGTLSIVFSGGEPLLRSDICDILYKARELDFCISLFSNLTLLNDDILKCIKDVNIEFVQTSIYSLIPECHDKITQLDGSLLRTLGNLSRLSALNVPIRISCPVMKSNLTSCKDVFKWAISNNYDLQSDLIIMARNNCSTDNLCERIKASDVKSLLSDFSIKNTSPFYKEEKAISNSQSFCNVANFKLCLGADGSFYPCSGWQGLSVGSVSQKIKDVWEHSEQLMSLRNIKISSFPSCISCKNRDYCSMCLARNFNESDGDMMKINSHYCEVAKIRRDIFADRY